MNSHKAYCIRHHSLARPGKSLGRNGWLVGNVYAKAEDLYDV